MCGQRAAVHFYLSLGLVQVCEIEISQIGKNNGNPDLVCENIVYIRPKIRVCLFVYLAALHKAINFAVMSGHFMG